MSTEQVIPRALERVFMKQYSPFLVEEQEEGTFIMHKNIV